MFMDLLLSSLKRSSSWISRLVIFERFVRVLTLAVATVGVGARDLVAGFGMGIRYGSAFDSFGISLLHGR